MECPICLADCTFDHMSLSSCDHKFHSDCIIDWLCISPNKNCPCCRSTPNVTKWEIIGYHIPIPNSDKTAIYLKMIDPDNPNPNLILPTNYIHVRDTDYPSTHSANSEDQELDDYVNELMDLLIPTSVH